MSSIHSKVDGENKDSHLHTPLLDNPTGKITPARKFAVDRYKSMGLSEQEAKALVLNKPV